jgi:hypothetical protein
MARESVQGAIVLPVIEVGESGVKINANKLSRIVELRVGTGWPEGCRTVQLRSESGNPQDAGVFSGVEGVELVVALSGGMRIWTRGGDGKPVCTRYRQGEVAYLNPAEIHATHPDKGAVVVGLMVGDWSKAKKSADLKFDAAVDEALAAKA